MTPDYIKQKDSYSCVPIAIANACKWAGNKDFDDEAMLKQLRVICDTKKPVKKRTGGIKTQGGTCGHNTHKGITSRDEFRLVEQKYNPSIKDIKWHLDKGGAVILCYKNWKVRNNGHACLIDKRKENTYRIVNGRSSDAFSWESNVYLRKILARKARYGYKPCAYFIVKGDKK